jgi:hypothetical protein
LRSILLRCRLGFTETGAAFLPATSRDQPTAGSRVLDY